MSSEIANRLPASDDFIGPLATLQTRLIDVLAGYRTMRERAEPEIIPIVDEYIALDTRHEAELAARLMKSGHEPDEDGSFFSIIQQSVVRVRAIVSQMGTNILPQVIDGERSVLDLYRETLAHAELATDRELLERQMRALADMIGRTEALVGT